MDAAPLHPAFCHIGAAAGCVLPHGILPQLSESYRPQHTSGILTGSDLVLKLLFPKNSFQIKTALLHGVLLGLLLRSQRRFLLPGGTGHQAQCHKGNGQNAAQTHPEAVLLIVQHSQDPLLYADLAEGDGADKVRLLCAALQQRSGVGFPLLRLHELHHPLITGHFDVPAQQDVGKPHKRVEPVQSQGQEADHLDPVIPLVQMGAFMLQNVLPGLFAHAHGDVDSRLDEAQDKGGIDPVAFPAAPDAHSLPHLLFQPHIGHHTVNTEAKCHSAPDPGNHRCPPGIRKSRRHGNLGLQAQIALDLHRQQQPDPCQQPQQADVFLRGSAQDQPRGDYRKDHDAAVKTGGKQVFKHMGHIIPPDSCRSGLSADRPPVWSASCSGRRQR